MSVVSFCMMISILITLARSNVKILFSLTCSPAGCGYHNNKDIYQVATSFMFDETFRMDATLKELAGLIKQMNPDARKKGTFIDFYVVYPSSIPGRWLQRDIGSVCVGMYI